MKKNAVIIMTVAALAAFSAPITASAAAVNSVNVSFELEALNPETNKTYLVLRTLTVTDADKNGKLTMEDALYCAHEAYYPGGAAAGLDEQYIWGAQGGYTATLFDKNNVCVYTSSGRPDCAPSEEREELKDGDYLSWTAQWYSDKDSYFLSVDGMNYGGFNVTAVGEQIKVHVGCVPRFKKDAGKIDLTRLTVRTSDKNSGVHPDQNGDATVTFTEANKNGFIILSDENAKDGSDLYYLNCFVREKKENMAAYVDIFNGSLPDDWVYSAMTEFSECDSDGIYTAYDAICTAMKTDSANQADDLKNSVLWGKHSAYTVQVNEGTIYPLSMANKLPVNLSDNVRVHAVNSAETTAAAAVTTTKAAATTTKAAATTTKAAATTTKAAAVTTTTDATSAVKASTTTTTSTTTAATTTKAASTTKAAVTTAGGVKTGDAMPVAALALAGLSAAGAAVVCTSKRREK